MKKSISTSRTITLLFIALYPVLPSYFRIARIESGLFLAMVYVLTYLMSIQMKVRLKTKLVLVVGICAGLNFIPGLVHRQNVTMVRSIVEDFAVVICLTHYFITAKSTMKALDEALHTLIGVCAVMCLCGILDSVTKHNVFSFMFNGTATDMTPDLQMRGAFARSEATFGHAITFGVYLGFCGLISMYYAIGMRKKVWGIVLVLIVVALLLTVSRGPILFFFVAGMIFLFLLGFRQFVKTSVMIIITAGVAFILLGLLFPEMQEKVKNVFLMVGALFSENMAAGLTMIENNDPFWYRLGLYSALWPYIRENLFCGSGIDLTFRFAYGGHSYYSVDNEFLRTLLVSGIVGLCGFVYPMIFIICTNLRKVTRKITPQMKGLLVCSACLYAMNMFSVAQMTERRMWIVFFAIACSCYYMKGNAQGKALPSGCREEK